MPWAAASRIVNGRRMRNASCNPGAVGRGVRPDSARIARRSARRGGEQRGRGGADRARNADFHTASVALYQLSYSPEVGSEANTRLGTIRAVPATETQFYDIQ